MQGHGGPRGATGGHGEAQKKPWNNTGGHGGPQPAAKKSGHTPRGATGGHGGPRGATGGHGRQPKSPGTTTAPFNILEDPYKLRLFGESSLYRCLGG